MFLGRVFSTLSLVYLVSVPLDSPAPIYIVVLVSSVIGSISAPALSTLVLSLFEKDRYVQVNARLNLATDAPFWWLHLWPAICKASKGYVLWP